MYRANLQKMVLLFVIFASFVSSVAAETCYRQQCLGCHPQTAEWPGRITQCDPSNWVTAEWVHNLGYPPPRTDSRIPIEYRCLKLVATPDDKTYENVVDVIRGCVPRRQVDSVCQALEAVERARGHSDARCHICSGNNCNNSARAQITLFFIFTSVLLYFVLR